MTSNFGIKYAKNGLILTGPDGDIVFANAVDGKTEVELFVEFLQTINECYGPTTSRYSKQRVHVNIVEGDKYND